MVRRARRDRTRHRGRRGVGGQPADVVARPGAIRSQAGTPLFDRVNRRLRLNAYGQIMLEHARRSIAEMQSATERIAALRDPDTGRVRARISAFAGELVCAGTTSRFRELGARDRFDLFQGPAHEITQRVRSGQADIAITRRVPRRPASSGTGCTSNNCAWPFRADTGWPAEPGCGCRPRRRAVRRARRASPDCGSSPTNCGQRTASTLTSCSRPPRSRRWKDSSRRDSASPSFPFRAMAATPRPSMFRSPTLGAKREVGLVWDRDRATVAAGRTLCGLSQHAVMRAERMNERLQTMHWTH